MLMSTVGTHETVVSWLVMSGISPMASWARRHDPDDKHNDFGSCSMGQHGAAQGSTQHTAHSTQHTAHERVQRPGTGEPQQPPAGCSAPLPRTTRIGPFSNEGSPHCATEARAMGAAMRARATTRAWRSFVLPDSGYQSGLHASINQGFMHPSIRASCVHQSGLHASINQGFMHPSIRASRVPR